VNSIRALCEGFRGGPGSRRSRRDAQREEPDVGLALFAPAVAPLAVVAGAMAAGCGSAAAAPLPPAPVAPASPPRDDGQAAEGGEGGARHAAALEELRVGPLGWRTDRQQSVRLLLPDAAHWLRVKFWGVESLVGFRYGKDHHAIVGAIVVSVPDESETGACGRAFEKKAQPWIESFDVALAHDRPQAIDWNGKIVEIDSLVATTATLGVRDTYAIAYGAFPAWRGACVVIGIGVPARNELERAKAVRDRFVSNVLPRVQVVARTEPRERD
jgi:hypothetical protein